MDKDKNVILKAYKFVISHEKMYLITSILGRLIIGTRPFISIYYSRKIINSLMLGSEKELVLKYILLAIGLNLILSVLKSVLDNRDEYYQARLYRKLEMEKNQKVIDLDYEFIEKEDTQNMVQNIKMLENNGNHGFRSLLFATYIGIQGLITIILSILLSKGAFMAEASIAGISGRSINIIFILFLIIINTISFIVLARFNTKVSKFVVGYANGVFRLYAAYQFLTVDYKSGKDIRIYGKKLPQKHNKEMAKELSKMYKGLGKMFSIGNGIPSLVSNITIGAIYLYVGWKAIIGAITIGEIVQYTAAITILFEGVNNIITAISSTVANKVYFNQLFGFLELDGGKYMGSIPMEKRLDNKYHIEFKNVSFKYPGTENYVLKNINLKLNIGERLAIVGMNGSGKTTFIKLLIRLYDPTEGEILLNGIDIKSYDYDEYLRIFSVVFQDFKLFSFGLGQNVGATVEYDKDRVLKSLNEVGFDKRIDTLEKGLDTPLYRDFDENGIEISGGEAQKIAMARAISKDRPF
ncbi:MAG: ABC transporter ATP-binding protein, partial [Tissierellia bacterium]|nr:ABC transporter ATP-binding protein [Tissierellia bacterium]